MYYAKDSLVAGLFSLGRAGCLQELFYFLKFHQLKSDGNHCREKQVVVKFSQAMMAAGIQQTSRSVGHSAVVMAFTRRGCDACAYFSYHTKPNHRPGVYSCVWAS
jgi:hypothetical protein